MDATSSGTVVTNQPSPSQPSTRQAQVSFTGRSGEYFGIWIVNILLSILTLGIYSAWATVRTNQYFYGHTRIENHAFRYLATPMQILRGRLLAAAIFVCYFAISHFFPLAGVILLFVLFIASPWLLIMSLRFNLRMTSYRQIRFAFHGRFIEAFLIFAVLPIASALTLFLALPWVFKKMDQYIYSNISYGGKPLQFRAGAGKYYVASFASVGAVLLLGFIFGIGVFASLFLLDNGKDLAPLIPFIVIPFYLLTFSLSGAIYGGIVRNHIYNNSELDGVSSFHSNVKIMPYAWLLMSNFLLLIISLGLAYPWTCIRKSRFLAKATALNIQPEADTLIDTVEQKSSATGEEAAGFFDADISLA
ncbi:YjgN family protein [Nitrincola sp. MINF-07-Sa-05]|uniref:YjgN family protein n=1 Tax=Nitrincola salilacus TaxID=3400273 RepID=UPI003917CC52